MLLVLEVHEDVAPSWCELLDRLPPPRDVRRLVAFVAQAEIPVVGGDFLRRAHLLAIRDAKRQVAPAQRFVDLLIVPGLVAELEGRTRAGRQTCEELVAAFCAVASTLGPRLGVLLFQFPPTFRRSLGVLEQFLACLPAGTRAAFEFRHESWHDPEVYDALRRRNLALCLADSEKMSTPQEITADYGYFRLRDEGYESADITRWGKTIERLASSWTDVFVYFKHEEQGIGPLFAQQLREALTRSQ